jgi:hypothetical protein
MQAAHPHMRMVGQAHGHNFLPNDGITCEACRLRDVCSANNIFASLDDRIWMNAVHTREPWALCQIFGLSARGDLLQGLFGLREGRLQERPFYLIPEFDPTPWE